MTEVRQRFDVRQQHQHQQPSSPLHDNDVSGEAEDHQAAAATSSSSPALVPADLKLVQLRTELKKLGLSPSGLKHVLVKRLEEALARLGRGGSQARSDPNKSNKNQEDDDEDDDDGGDDDDAREPEVQPQALSFPSINRPPLLARSSAVKSFARRGGQHLLHTSDDGADDNLEDLRQGRQRHRRQPQQQQQQQRSPHGDEGDDAEGFDDDYDEAYVGVHASSGSLLDRKDAPSKKRKLPSSSSTSSSSSSSKQRSRHGKPASKKQRPSLSSLSSLVDAMATTPLSGHTFTKEARYAHPQQLQQQQQPVEEIKSLEQFRFEDSTFHFTYQFWRGQTLLHSFEIEAGTFTVLDEADAEPGSPPPSADAPASSSTTTTSMTSTSSTAAATSTTTTMTTTMTTSTRQRRVVLRWPSPVYYPLLQTWRFHQTYSHLLLHEPSVSDGLASSVPSSPAAAVAPSILTHSAPSSYPSSPLTAPSALASAAVPCLISRLGSVFVPAITEE